MYSWGLGEGSNFLGKNSSTEMPSGNKVHIGCMKLLKNPHAIMTYIITLAVPLNKINSQIWEFTNLWEKFWKQTNQIPSLLLVKPLPLNVPSTHCLNLIVLKIWGSGLWVWSCSFDLLLGFHLGLLCRVLFFCLDQHGPSQVPIETASTLHLVRSLKPLTQLIF